MCKYEAKFDYYFFIFANFLCLFLDDGFAAGIRYSDYDFPEADDLFANATVGTKSKSLPFPIVYRPNRTWPYFWGYSYNVFQPSTPYQLYALPER